MERLRVLFLCTGNSARSQIAEGLFRKLSRGRADVFSAGTAPEPEVHPLAVDVLRMRFQVDTDDLFPRCVIEQRKRVRRFLEIQSGFTGASRILQPPRTRRLPAVHQRLDAAEA